MPHAALKLIGGANVNSTETLNENSGISFTQLIRYFYDPNGITSVQKLGGWTKFFSIPMVAIVRALWAWEDLNDTSHLALGTQTIAGSDSAQLGVITNGTLQDVTPSQLTTSSAATFSSKLGSPIILVSDPNATGITNYDSVYIATQVSIGGVVLFGLYPTDPDGYLSGTSYTVEALDQLGNPLLAATTSALPVLPSFRTATGSSTVNVNLPAFPYAVDTTFSVLVSTSVGGITLYGNYVVQSIVDANNFKIVASAPATFADTQILNGGLTQFIYNIGYGALPPGTGYGIGGYGRGGYGTGTPVSPPEAAEGIPAVDWTLDNWGEILIACADQANQAIPYQPIYQWPPGQPTATVIPQAPPVNDGMFVAMPQRQIVAWGSTQTGIQDPLLVNWCDVGNYNSWIATVVNQAGSYRIPKGSRIVGGVQGPQQGIIWTDIDCWSMQYIGPPYVYSFNEIGTGCGLIARKAAIFVNGIGYWMGFSQFYTLSSNGVQPIPCPIWDVIFQNLNTASDPLTGVPYTQKIRVAVNSRFGEIQWFYPSLSGGGEIDSYVKFNYYLDLFDYGTLARTAWIDQSVLGPPIGADPQSLYLYQHETSNDADDAPMLPSFQTGYNAISEADVKAFVDWIWPDMKWGMYNQAQTATVKITFFVADYPGDTPQQYGPYPVTQATEYFYTRFRGRLVSIKISSDDLGSWWRIGLIRYRYSIDGKI